MKNNRILYLNLLRDSMTKLSSKVYSPILRLLHMLVSASFNYVFEIPLTLQNYILYRTVYNVDDNLSKIYNDFEMLCDFSFTLSKIYLIRHI